MERGFTIIELLIVVGISIGGFFIISSFLRPSTDRTEMSCSEYGSVPVSDLPVRCYGYYNIKEAK